MQLEQALDLFYLDNGFYPTAEQGLSALVTKPSIPLIPSKYGDKGYIKNFLWTDGRENSYTLLRENRGILKLYRWVQMSKQEEKASTPI